MLPKESQVFVETYCHRKGKDGFFPLFALLISVVFFTYPQMLSGLPQMPCGVLQPSPDALRTLLSALSGSLFALFLAFFFVNWLGAVFTLYNISL
ncbi:MAG: hypothetical protein PVH88_12635 [Ignavibacteria bacterium]|jgi:hypothetical protein